MQLAYNHALGAINNERSTACNHRHLTHVDLFIFEVVFLTKAKLNVKGYRVSNPLSDTLNFGRLRVSNRVGHEFQNETPIITFDGKDFAKDSFDTVVLSFEYRGVLLQKIQVGVDLNFNQIWWT